MNKKRSIFLILFSLLLTGGRIFSQSTISDGSQPNLSNNDLKSGKKHKLLIVPFEPHMYMSQIDHKINAETKWDQKKIKAAFREGLDEELFKKTKQKMDVLALLEDTIKYRSDLELLYSKITYKYDKIPDQNKFNAPKNEKEQKFVQKGQLMAVSDNEKKFMNAVVKDKSLLSGFTSKYKTDLFLFINELDITSNMDPNGINTNNPRTLTVHYTVFSKDGKEINSGISTATFPQDVNSPSKISSKYFSKIAEDILSRIEKAIAPTK